MAYRVFDDSGLTALMDTVKGNKETAESASSAVSSLSSTVTTLAANVTATFEEVDSELTTLDSQKQTKYIPVMTTLSAASWYTNTDTDSVNEGYAYCYDLTVSGADADYDSAEVLIHIEFTDEAATAGICPTCDVLDDTIRLYAVECPSADIDIQYRLIKG